MSGILCECTSVWLHGKYDTIRKIIIYRHRRVEANGWKRTGKYSCDSAKRKYVMIKSFVMISEMLLNCSISITSFLNHGVFVARISLSLSFPPSVWKLSGVWSTAEVLFLLAQSILFSPQHEGGALWQLNPTLATIPSTCLTPFFSTAVQYLSLLYFAFIYIYTLTSASCVHGREKKAIENHYKGIHNPSKELEWASFMQMNTTFYVHLITYVYRKGTQADFLTNGCIHI